MAGKAAMREALMSMQPSDLLHPDRIYCSQVFLPAAGKHDALGLFLGAFPTGLVFSEGGI